ncbi:hypothetical protein QQS21_011344 [Conoideocrella luteorostrata]|uniref:Uncharacterized protein n=1 Tax=Conoideocrella luteorostrata TaxID=1105319 RepID=A0AAJ0CDK5_9HYPO|nr:hypothetical protein QQS21_011344 [Conoideocrella luteorostrata]
MAILTLKSQLEERQRQTGARRGPFTETKHYIGRLGYRIIAHKQLIKDACDVAYLFSTFNVCVVNTMPSVPPPQVDSHTSLTGILNRMLRNKDPERLQIENALLKMDHHSGIFRDFMQEFLHCTPMVHAEIHILEHFFTKKLMFLGNDKYVACSKAACLCCKLYFQYHPARMVIPGSHEKIWSSWGPPAIAVFRKHDDESDRQRDILNKMIAFLRNDAIVQTLKCSRPPAWHPDSQTALSDIVTHEIASDPLELSINETKCCKSISRDKKSLIAGLAPFQNSIASVSPGVAIGTNKYTCLADFNENSDDSDGGVCISDLNY